MSAVCPIPTDRYPVITLAHGGGGRLMNQLIEQMFEATLGNGVSAQRHDCAVVPWDGEAVAISTDSFVVHPLVFPGGSIGKLAVYGTANDLAMGGAQPVALTLGLILEEGLPIPTLWSEVLAIRQACQEVGVRVVAGDTKVVDRGKGDGMFINTTGIGRVRSNTMVAPGSVQPGDAILLSGDLGRHGMAVMSAREGLGFDASFVSDCASVVEPALALIEEGIDVHCMRDLTRGGLASALNEVATVANLSMHLEETKIPVHAEVRSACEIFGLDPLYVANEGRFVAWVPGEQAVRATEILQGFPVSAGATRAGTVEGSDGIVVVENSYGASRVIDMLSGEQLPRIC